MNSDTFLNHVWWWCVLHIYRYFHVYAAEEDEVKVGFMIFGDAVVLPFYSFRPLWCVWAQDPQAPEIPPRDASFSFTVPGRPASIHGGKVQRACRGGN